MKTVENKKFICELENEEVRIYKKPEKELEYEIVKNGDEYVLVDSDGNSIYVANADYELEVNIENEDNIVIKNEWQMEVLRIKG